ncbi:MAG: M50 family metallopeptidase [Propioniciclava sp.]
MNTAVMILGGVGFFALLMASVALHEVGHMVPAKLFGVKVPKFFVGFGPTLWSIKRGETEYGIKWIPLGGFVQLLGMYPPRNPAAKPSSWQRFADDARAAEWEDISPGDRGRLFYERSTLKKLIIMFGGPAMNLVIAFVLLWGIVGLHGISRSTSDVYDVAPCVITEVRDDYTCTDADPVSPASQAGLQAGDRIVSFNGVAVDGYDELGELIRANLGQPATIVVERSGQTVTLPTVNTIVQQVPSDIDPGRLVEVGYLGFYPVREVVTGGPGDALVQMGQMVQQSAVALAQFPVKIWNVAVDLVTGQPRDVNGPVSIVGVSAIAGQATATAEVSFGAKVVLFANLLAAVNLFLALFNLVPLPPLDGGHMAGALWEAVKRGWARLVRRPDPGFVDTARMLPVAYAVGGLLLLCGLVVIVADIVTPISIF